MARTVSAVFKFQGTIEDVTHVNSKAYGPHVRAKKNSKTPFVVTDALATSRDRLQLCNQYLRPVFLALRPEGCDGRSWSRLVSQQFAELRAGRSLNLECLQGFECNLQHPLGDVIKSNYDFSATVVQNQLRVHVRLDGHPVVNDELPRTGYQLKVVAIFRDAEGAVHKEVRLGPLTQYGSTLETVELGVPVPAGGGEYILLLGVVPHLQGQGATKVMSDSGMKVVGTGEVDGATSLKVEKREGEGGNVAGSRLQVAGETPHTGSREKTVASYQLPDTGSRLQDASCKEVEKVTGLRVGWPGYSFSSNSTSVPVYRYG